MRNSRYVSRRAVGGTCGGAASTITLAPTVAVDLCDTQPRACHPPSDVLAPAGMLRGWLGAPLDRLATGHHPADCAVQHRQQRGSVGVTSVADPDGAAHDRDRSDDAIAAVATSASFRRKPGVRAGIARGRKRAPAANALSWICLRHRYEPRQIAVATLACAVAPRCSA
jgi:hypothetical protein